MGSARRVRDDTRGLTAGAALVGTAALAWALTAGRMSGMDMGPATELGGLGWFAISWVLMMSAMMLPSLVPATAVSREPGAFAAGYLLAWTGAGLVAYGAIDAVRSLDLGWLAWDRAGRYVAAGAILAAAAYQLTPAKKRCLERCRKWPVHGRLPAAAASPAVPAVPVLLAGLRHGASCVGCCAGMMAALFALGVMSLTWMAVVAALIAAERLLTWRAPAVYGVAVVLAALAVWIAVAPGTLPGFTVPGAMGGM
jgi:predicted metal-binding membrane protein